MTAYKVFVFCTIKKIVKIAQLIINQYINNKQTGILKMKIKSK